MGVIPFRDDDSGRRTFPYVNLFLIGLNILAYVYVYYLVDPATQQNILQNYVAIPREILQGQDVPPVGPSPLWVTVFTSMFLHANLLHIAGNMLFLFIFGDNVEDAFGHARYLAFYLLCGVAAALTQLVVVEMFQPQAIDGGELGASGAIAGVLGAYIVLFPRARILTLIGLGIFFITRLPATIVIGAWFLLQFIPGLATVSSGDGTAYFAHVGGFVAGALLVLILRPLGPRRLRVAPVAPVPPGYSDRYS